MQLNKVILVFCLLITISTLTLCSALVIPQVTPPTTSSTVVTIADPVSNNDGWYKPPICYSCVKPTPAPVYEKVGMAFTIDPSKSTFKQGSTITLTAYQTSGTTLGSSATWQWDIPSGTSSMLRLNGAIVSAKLTKVGKNTIYIRVRDEAKGLTGQALQRITVVPK